MIQECYDLAAKNGWHEEQRPLAHSLLLISDEALEAQKALASGFPQDFVMGDFEIEAYKERGKETVATELADIVIRSFDTAKDHNINLLRAIVFKLVYNQTRGYRHGGKVL